MHSFHLVRSWILLMVAGCLLVLLGPDTSAWKPQPAELSIDLVNTDRRDNWFRHPAVGDASFDAFERIPGNPIYVGKAPYHWTANGYLFARPDTGDKYAYVVLTPRGYFPPPPAQCQLLRLKAGAKQWEDLGVVLAGSAKSFESNAKGIGATADPSICHDDGKYHMVYDWGKPDLEDIGLAYACADKPEGPFIRAGQPLHASSQQKFLQGAYKSVYAGTLIKRARDWLILAGMSTEKNAGGVWAMVGLTAAKPEGPYQGPTLLLYPQSQAFLATPLEYYPAFVHEDFVYAPATSLANRCFQVIYRAKLEDAHRAEAWQLYQYGSTWHAEPVDHEAWGIWGQTFSGYVTKDGTFEVLFTSKDKSDVGTVGLARRPWATPYKSGFTLSACEAPALTIYQRTFATFRLAAHVRSNGPKKLIWNHNAPLGTDRIWHAGGQPHRLTLADCTEFALHAGGWTLHQVAADSKRTVVAEGTAPKSRALTADIIEVQQAERSLAVRVNGQEVWGGDTRPRSGSVGFIADARSVLAVDRLLVSSNGDECWKSLLPTDAISGAGALPNTWAPVEGQDFRYGFGFRSTANGAMAKWNYVGKGFRLWEPRGPGLGTLSILVDGRPYQDLVLNAETAEKSAVRCQRALATGFHTVSLVRKEGKVICDSLEFLP